MGGGLFAISSTPAEANTVGVDLDYNCTGIGGPDSVGNGTKLRVTVTAPTTMTVGRPIDVKWAIAYRGQTAFTAPVDQIPGAVLSARGTLRIEGPWRGRDVAEGSLKQQEVKKGDPLAPPSLVTGEVGATKPGEIRITPQRLVVNFTPAVGEKTINDDDPSLQYLPVWQDFNDRKPPLNNIGQDVHGTEQQDASVALTFAGTGVDFITERDHRAGPLEFKIDDRPIEEADPSKNEDDSPVTGENIGGYTLWKVRDLPYKLDHKLTIKNVAAKWAIVDAFKVVTQEFKAPPSMFRAVCTPVQKNVTFRITVGDQPSPTPHTPTPSSTNTNNGGQNGNGGQSTPTATATATATVTASPSSAPTTTRTVTATATPQVEITPVGAPQTGESPAPPSGAALIGAGSAMLVGAIMGGVALRRRRAAHAGAGQ
ncbi:hypothetical protein C1I98_20070 [Spongiactinospora gelatinilytica]|uniref:Uncharacterized protein n=1 Tax=Spongiactinospora gelatinilytica TaxID=2666298 RepID=A0A2W2G2K8_9ACTN|nr:hypothetical protein C1I98_20070 [Spongiactinospora gelatinilytica]